MKTMIKGIVIGAIAVISIALVVWLAVVYTGAYNVAATDAHADVVRWSLDTTMERSVANRSEDVALPESLSDAIIAKGGKHYAESCAHCHGAPGAERAPWAEGMRPLPPELAKAAAHWKPAEIYWIVENGIKMSGMPAFGPHHTPEDIAAITGFVSKLPGLTPEGYASLTGTAEHE